MFDHRLGSLLGASIGAIHALPYPEYFSWYLFYLLEPWGYDVEEGRVAKILAMLHNINSPRNKSVSPKTYIQDRLKAILEELREPGVPEGLTREQLMKLIRKDLGIK